MKKIATFLALTLTLSPFAQEVVVFPHGLGYFRYQGGWIFAPKSEKQEAIDKAWDTLALLKLYHSRYSAEEYAKKKIEAVPEKLRPFLTTSWEGRIGRSFIIEATDKAIEQWAEGEGLDTLMEDIDSIPYQDHDFFGLFKASYFMNPSSVIYTNQGLFYRAPLDDLEIHPLTELPENTAKRVIKYKEVAEALGIEKRAIEIALMYKYAPSPNAKKQ